MKLVVTLSLALVVPLVFAASAAADTVLLSSGKPAAATSSASGHEVRYGNDSNVSTTWRASSRSLPQSWRVDLGGPSSLEFMTTYWPYGTTYTYSLAGSNDLRTWEQFFQGRGSGRTKNVLFGTYRYVRVNVTGSSTGRAAEILEARVYGSRVGSSAPAPSQPSTPAPAPSPAPTTPAPAPTPPPVTPSPLPIPSPWVPAASSISVTSYGARANDTTDDTAGIQAAVNSCGNRGGSISFPAGTYMVSAPIKLPAGNTNVLTLAGVGATIKLTNTKPRFLAWNRTSAGQVFRNFVIRGFKVDAQGKHPASGSYSVLGFDDANIGGYHTPSSISIQNLTVKDCTVVNVATSPRSVWNACGINVFMTGTGSITDVTIDGCRVEGGSRGINVWAADASSNVVLDRLLIQNSWHDTMVNPVAFSASTNYHVGQFAKVGTITLRNNYGARAFDCGIEIDQPTQGLIENNVIENCYYNEYYYTNFKRPLSGSGQTIFRNNTANVTIPVYGGTGFTIASEGVSIGAVKLEGFTTNLRYGTKVPYQVNSGVSISSFMVDGRTVR